MAESTPSPAFSWKCPACGRRVPARVATCRCGHVLDADEAAALSALSGDAPVESAESDNSSARATVLAIVLAFAAVAGVLYWLHSRRPAPENPAEVAVPVVGEEDDRKVSEPAGGTPTAAPDAAAPQAEPSTPAAAPAPAATPAPAPTTPPATPGSGGSMEDVIGSSMPAVVRVETPLGSGSG